MSQKNFEDFVEPFFIKKLDLTGRVIRMSSVLQEILTRHVYPPLVEVILAQAIVCAVALARSIKYEGKFTFQIKSDGPINLLIVDVTSEGIVRAYARYDEDQINSLKDAQYILGQGYLAFTVDQVFQKESYQGIVELQGSDIAASVLHYFKTSEQLRTGFKMAVEKSDQGQWFGTCVMIQDVGKDPTKPHHVLAAKEDQEDAWIKAMILLSSLKDGEMLDESLTSDMILYRLFHEDEVMVYPSTRLCFGCLCSREKLEAVLILMPKKEVESIKIDGIVEAKCEFCGQKYQFTEQDLDHLDATRELKNNKE